jgi:two-component system cell cycle response regulator
MKKNTVLLVEEDLWDAGLVEVALAEIEETQYLRIAGSAFQMIHVQSMEGALDVLSEITVDIVLADLNLPDSKALHSYFRIQTQFPDVPVVVFCGRDEEALAVSAVREGAQDYLIKDEVDCVPLARCLHYAIERHRSKGILRPSRPYDELTGVYTHEPFSLLAGHSLRLAARLNLTVLVAIAEVASGSGTDDSFARQERDLSLLGAADVLRANFDAGAAIGRLSPSRFAVVALFADQSSAEVMSEQLAVSVEGHNGHSSRQAKLPVRLGVRVFDAGRQWADESDIDPLLSLVMESMPGGARSALTTA